jgi:phage terminase large subunit-like protein
MPHQQLGKMSLVHRSLRSITAAFIVEAAGSGISLISSLRKAGLSCICYRPKEDKMYRAALVLPIFVEGRVFLVKKARKALGLSLT